MEWLPASCCPLLVAPVGNQLCNLRLQVVPDLTHSCQVLRMVRVRDLRTPATAMLSCQQPYATLVLQQPVIAQTHRTLCNHYLCSHTSCTCCSILIIGRGDHKHAITAHNLIASRSCALLPHAAVMACHSTASRYVHRTCQPTICTPGTYGHASPQPMVTSTWQVAAISCVSFCGSTPCRSTPSSRITSTT